MEPARAAQALAEASASMTTTQHDVVGALTTLLEQSGIGLGVDASGILVESAGRLELLVSSSHEASELEAHQLHVDEGPCIEAYTTGASVQAHSKQALSDRWPSFARTMLDAGFESVHAAPLVFRGETFGAMGLFRRADVEFTADESVVARAFADIATMLVFRLAEVPADQLAERLKEALGARVVLEQAKGVLADAHDVSMAEAYTLLVQGAREHDRPLTEWAAHLIRAAQARPENRL